MPRKSGNKRLDAEVTQSTSDLVDEAAQKRGITKAEYIRQAIYEALRRDGLKPENVITGRGKYPRN